MKARSPWKLIAFGLVASVGTVVCQSQNARMVRGIPWTGQGVWLKADTHIHTRFSDGSNTVEEVVAKAASFGCDVVAITDHSDRDLRGATPEYFAAIEAARKAYPKMVILAGVEWNVAPWGGEEHATVLMPPSAETKLAAFKEQFDDLSRPTHDERLTLDALRWLTANATVNGLPPVVLYQHPSRNDARSIENVPDIKLWRTASDVVVGFAGAPGHQNRNGSYDYKERPMDRWDPAVARIGDAWDTLLGEGLDVWAADAPSDFHNANPGDLNDFWPCQFSETWLYAAERTQEAVLRAYRAGSFFAAHGHIARAVGLKVTAPGLNRPAGVGEVLAARAGTALTAELHVEVPTADWQGSPNRIDRVEIIAIDRTGARVVAEGGPAAGRPALRHQLALAAGGVVLRARGFRNLPDGTRLAFYTNPVRVQAP
jgi:PHP domain